MVMRQVVQDEIGRLKKTSIRDQLQKHNSIHYSQHAVIKGRSCIPNLLSFYIKVIEAIDR